MSHGFSRFGPPSARDRFHQQARPAGTLAMILPTIFATLFMFTIVVTLNKAGNMSRGGKIVRLLNVDDVFPTQLDVEQNRKKEYWELTPPPPSPEAVMGGRESSDPKVDGPYITVTSQDLVPTRPQVQPLAPDTIPGFDPEGIPTAEIQPPTVAPDTSLPVATPTP